MKLELTATEDIIRNRFDIDTKYDNCRQRLKDHVLISSLSKVPQYLYLI